MTGIPQRLLMGFVFLLGLTSCMERASQSSRVNSPTSADPPIRQTPSPGDNKLDGTFLLLIFKAYPPHEKKERNLCELAREIKAFVDPNRFPPTGIVTEESIRYGVFTVMRTKLLKTTDSVASPKSQEDRAYVLAVDRTYKICARSYRLSNRRIAYVDYEDGNSYRFPVKTSGPFLIQEVEVSPANILRELWQEKRPRQ